MRCQTLLPQTRLVLFDGVCGLCDHVVQYLLDRDREARLTFAPLQGETAAELRARHAEIPDDIDTMVLVTNLDGEERVYLRSAAAFGVASALGGLWRAVAWLRVLPRPLTDLAYRAVAASRYHIFGKHDACRIPRPEERLRFLP